MKSVITVMSIVLQTGTTTAVGNREIRYYCNVDCFADWNNYSCGES